MFGRIRLFRRGIGAFTGRHAFLATTHRSRHPISEEVEAATLRYPTVRHAVIGMRYTCLSDKIAVSQISNAHDLPELYEADRPALLRCLRQKFQCPTLRERLIATGDARLSGEGPVIRDALEMIREEVVTTCSTIPHSSPSLGIEVPTSF